MNTSLTSKLVTTVLFSTMCAAVINAAQCDRVMATDQCAATPQVKKHDPYRQVENFGVQVGEQSDFPNLPHFTGHTIFGYGIANYNAKGGPHYTMTYSAKEDAATVLAWYEQTLQILKWDIDKEASRAGYVAATDTNGNMVHIAVSNPLRPGCKCDFMIQYKVRQRRR